MPRFRVVYERPEVEIEAEDATDAADRAYDHVCDDRHYIDFIEEIPEWVR